MPKVVFLGKGKNYSTYSGHHFKNIGAVQNYCLRICPQIQTLNSVNKNCEWVIYANENTFPKEKQLKGYHPKLFSFASFEKYIHEHKGCCGTS